MSTPGPTGSEGRAVPFHCPYCADEGLRPFGEEPGTWRCTACTRVFRLAFVGIAPDGARTADSRPGGGV